MTEENRKQKTKKLPLIFSFISLAYAIFAVVYCIAIFPRISERQVVESRKGLELEVLAIRKQMPMLTNYWVLVRELTEISDNKLSAYEIVEIAKIIITECKLHEDIGLTSSLIMGIMERESSFNPDAVSVAYAYGLMQCIQDVFERHLPGLGYERFTVPLALDPIVNVQVGIKELVRLRKYWKENERDSWLITVHSYFWGPKFTWHLLNTEKRVNVPGLEYSDDILRRARGWKEKGLM